VRSTDERTFRTLVGAANRIAGQEGEGELDAEKLMAEAKAVGLAYFDYWGRESQSLDNVVAQKLGDCAVGLAASRGAWKQVVKTAIPLLVDSARVTDGAISDAEDDKAAWDACMREIRAEIGADVGLDELIQRRWRKSAATVSSQLRARERLILSRAGTYSGHRRKPSRFLTEMGLA
jgi:DNA helicase II / ATP-dependent DNA helicase PcrA